MTDKELQEIIDAYELKHLGFLIERLPPIIERTEIRHYLGGLVAPETVRHAESTKKGPREVIKLGRKTAYPTASLLQWLEENGATVVKLECGRPRLDS